MKVIIKQIEGIAFVAKGNTNHWLSIDGPEEFYGTEAGSRPKELLLMALGSCTGSDVVSILKKKKVQINSIEIHVQGIISNEIPKVFTKIHLEYVFYGSNLDRKELERAIDLSQNKYCPISAMLQKACIIDYTYKIKK